MRGEAAKSPDCLWGGQGTHRHTGSQGGLPYRLPPSSRLASSCPTGSPLPHMLLGHSAVPSERTPTGPSPASARPGAPGSRSHGHSQMPIAPGRRVPHTTHTFLLIPTPSASKPAPNPRWSPSKPLCTELPRHQPGPSDPRSPVPSPFSCPGSALSTSLCPSCAQRCTQRPLVGGAQPRAWKPPARPPFSPRTPPSASGFLSSTFRTTRPSERAFLGLYRTGEGEVAAQQLRATSAAVTLCVFTSYSLYPRSPATGSLPSAGGRGPLHRDDSECLNERNERVMNG